MAQRRQHRQVVVNPRHDPQKFRDQVAQLLVDIAKAERNLRALTGISLRDHLEDFDNPHQVTSDQVGSPSDGEFQAHLDDTDNPHEVTSDQVGAPSDAEFQAHLDDVDNPHDTNYLNLSDTADTDYTGSAGYIPVVTEGEDGVVLRDQGVSKHRDDVAYQFDDLVSYGGTVWHCVADHPAQAFSLTYWSPIATATGSGVQMFYKWDSGTSGDPGTGRFAIDDDIANPTNTLRVSKITNGGNDVSIFWDNSQEGDFVMFVEDTGGAESGIWMTSGAPVDQGTYYEIPANWINNVGEPENNRKGIVSLVLSPFDRLPAGGEEGQRLSKASAANYDAEWVWPTEWRGLWVDQEYPPKSIVVDYPWTMVSNTTTSDRAGPQPVGSEHDVYTGTSPTDTRLAKTLLLGTEYTFSETAYLVSYRIYTVSGNQYSVYYTIDGGGAVQLLTFEATSTGWQEYPGTAQIVASGAVLELALYAVEPDPTPTTFTLSYDYDTPNNAAVPAAGQISHSNKTLASLRVNKTDQNGDQSAQLALITLGDVIEGAGMRWSVQGISDEGTWIDFGVAPAQQGSPDGVQDFIFETVTATPITTINDVDYYSAFPNVRSFTEIDGGVRIYTQDAHGVDIRVQDVNASPDWDFMAKSPDIGGAGTEPEKSAAFSLGVGNAVTEWGFESGVYGSMTWTGGSAYSVITLRAIATDIVQLGFSGNSQPYGADTAYVVFDSFNGGTPTTLSWVALRYDVTSAALHDFIMNNDGNALTGRIYFD